MAQPLSRSAAPRIGAADQTRLLVRQLAAIPFNPAAAGKPPSVPRFVKCPVAGSMANSPRVPLAALTEYRYLPSALIAISMLAEPLGLSPATVPGTAVSAPLLAMANPAMDDVPALDAYAK